MWHTLANGDVQTTVQFFLVTLHVDRYIRYMIHNKTGVLLSGSEDTIGAAIEAASSKLRVHLSGGRMPKDEIERSLIELTRLPVPLTKPLNHIQAAKRGLE